MSRILAVGLVIAACIALLLVPRAAASGHADGGSCQDVEAMNQATVAEVLEHAPDNMSILVNGVKRAGLDAFLADPNLEATILAPHNKAFQLALLKLKLTPKALYMDKAKLTDILSYHFIPNKVLKAADFKDGLELTTHQGTSPQPEQKGKLRVSVTKLSGVKICGGDEEAHIVAADIQAGKSIIHVIDNVLLPPPPPAES